MNESSTPEVYQSAELSNKEEALQWINEKIAECATVEAVTGASGKKYIRTPQAAKLLGVNMELIYHFRAVGGIRGFNSRGQWRWRVDQIEEILREMRNMVSDRIEYPIRIDQLAWQATMRDAAPPEPGFEQTYDFVYDQEGLTRQAVLDLFNS